jgi:hypothetical protein
MNKLQKDILKMQKFDALSMAEKLTGESYKESESTSALGFMLHIQKGQEMRDMLSKAGDTQFSNTVTDYLRITGNFGFEVVYKEPFNSERCEENLYVLFQKELGILICFDTFTWETGREPNVNGGNMYYNWSPNSLNKRGNLTSSGHFYFAEKGKHMTLFEKDLITKYEIKNYPESAKWESGLSYEEFKAIDEPISKEQKELFELATTCGKRFLWIGGHDCREGIITIIKAMFENGKFFPVWHDCPFSWITNYMEHKNNNAQYPFTEYYEVTKQRISRMPKYVQDCISETYKK